MLLNSANAGLAMKIQLMNEARQSIEMCYYAIDEDETGRYFLSAAIAAARRGVEVNIIVENHFSDLSREMVLLLQNNGINLHYYNPFRLQKGFKNLSWMHDKLLITDNHNMVTGGRNINNHYYDTPYPTENKFIDIEISIKGVMADNGSRYFKHLWTSAFTSPATIRKNKIDENKYLKLLYTMDSLAQHPMVLKDTALPKKIYIPDSLAFIHDSYNQWPKSSNVSHEVLRLIKSADSSLHIESPYAIAPARLFKELKKARERGVNISIVSNASATTDVLIAAAGYINDRRKFLKNHIAVYEYQGPHTLHSKTVVIDDETVIMGSYNFDHLSYKMNSEIIAVIYHKEFAKEVAENMKNRLKGCKQIWKPGQKNDKLGGKERRKLYAYRILLKLFPVVKRLV